MAHAGCWHLEQRQAGLCSVCDLKIGTAGAWHVCAWLSSSCCGRFCDGRKATQFLRRVGLAILHWYAVLLERLWFLWVWSSARCCGMGMHVMLSLCK